MEEKNNKMVTFDWVKFQKAQEYMWCDDCLKKSMEEEKNNDVSDISTMRIISFIASTPAMCEYAIHKIPIEFVKKCVEKFKERKEFNILLIHDNFMFDVLNKRHINYILEVFEIRLDNLIANNLWFIDILFVVEHLNRLDEKKPLDEFLNLYRTVYNEYKENNIRGDYNPPIINYPKFVSVIKKMDVIYIPLIFRLLSIWEKSSFKISHLIN